MRNQSTAHFRMMCAIEVRPQSNQQMVVNVNHHQYLAPRRVFHCRSALDALRLNSLRSTANAEDLQPPVIQHPHPVKPAAGA